MLPNYSLAPKAVFDSNAGLGEMVVVEILSDVWDGFVIVKSDDGEIATVAVHELLYR